MNKFAFLLIAAAIVLRSAFAAPVRVDAVEVELVADRSAAVPGAPLSIGLRIRHDPHWHTYWRFPGDSGLPTQLDLKLPEGWKAGEIAWPAPKRINIGPLGNYGLDGEVVLPVPVVVPASAANGSARIVARAQWLMCREVCIPGETDVELSLPVGTQASPSAHAALFERAAASTPRETLRAGVSIAGGSVSLAFDHPSASSAEFFPYREGLVAAAAPQSLYRLGDGRAWRIELRSAEAVPGAPADLQRWTAGAAGLLVVDGKPFELEVSSAASASTGGTLVSKALGETAGAVPGAAGGLSGLVRGAAAPGVDGTAQGADGVAQGPGGEAASLAFAAAFGLIGGLLLNLMPCVFPVIGLKVLGFAAHADAGSAERRAGALAFGAGVLASFWGLAGLLLALRAAGQAVGWGFQLQSPAFVAAMALLFVTMGLNFAGVFEVGVRLTRLGGLDPLQSGSGGAIRSFGSGVLAVMVATPCTAPFMGSALGYTLGRPALEVLVVFGAIAVGMALPYVVFGLYPSAVRMLPRPGRWMESFRQLLAFPMFATVAWLAWVLGQQAGIDAVLRLALGAILVALAAWLYGRFVQAVAPSRRLAAVLAVVSLATGVWLALPSGEFEAATGAADGGSAAGALGADAAARGAQAGGWEPWSEARVAEGVAAGRIVFIDFTAAWCVSCQANKKLVLDRGPVVAEMQRLGVLRLRADWTNRDAAITAALARYGRNGVPLYLVHRPGEARARVLPEILTSGIVTAALGGR